MKETFEIQSSSRISRVVFKTRSRDIEITFKSKGNPVYLYHSVARFDFETFRNIIKAQEESVGKAFEKYIRNKYAGQKQ